MNINQSIIQRIEDYRVENKNPCKNYATESAAEKATAKAAMNVAKHFAIDPNNVQSARYVVIYDEYWQRWVGAIDMTELLRRSSMTGGYIGIEPGFFKF